jgi:hypothetical protein
MIAEYFLFSVLVVAVVFVFFLLRDMVTLRQIYRDRMVAAENFLNKAEANFKDSDSFLKVAKALQEESKNILENTKC